MLVTITGKHIEITDAIRAHVEDKASKLPRYFNSVSQVEVILEGNSGVMQSAEVIVSAEHYPDLIAKEKSEDLYTCIDLVMHKIERQLHKVKEKQRGNKHASPAGREGSQVPPQSDEEVA